VSRPWQRLRWEKGRRYYEVHLHQDLWGQWVLTRCWGGRGSAWGQVRTRPCASYTEALAQLEQIKKRHVQRHYQLVVQRENN
jgi:WGR domain-containing protein